MKALAPFVRNCRGVFRPIFAAVIVGFGLMTVPAMAEDPTYMYWGDKFRKCDGAKEPQFIKAATEDSSSQLAANGIIVCTDEGDSYVYKVQWMRFMMSRDARWEQVHLDWFGCAAQKAGTKSGNDWIYDEAKPIKVTVSKGQARAINNITCRIAKSKLQEARGFGFYVVGGGVVWSIFML